MKVRMWYVQRVDTMVDVEFPIYRQSREHFEWCTTTTYECVGEKSLVRVVKTENFAGATRYRIESDANGYETENPSLGMDFLLGRNEHELGLMEWSDEYTAALDHFKECVK